MFNTEDIGARSKDLETNRNQIIEDLKKLEEDYKKGKINEKIYQEKRHEIERELVEIMDRLAQMHFLMGK